MNSPVPFRGWWTMSVGCRVVLVRRFSPIYLEQAHDADTLFRLAGLPAELVATFTDDERHRAAIRIVEISRASGLR